MSVRTNPKTPSRSNFDIVFAGIGVLLATAWFVMARHVHVDFQTTQAKARVAAAETMLASHQRFEATRLSGAVEMLAGDQRIRQIVLDSLDEATLVDSFTDIQAIDKNSLHAILTPSGRVAAVVGAPALKGSDLSSSALVKAALASDGPSTTARWLLDGKLTEVAAAPLRQGERLRAIVIVGNSLAEEALNDFAAGAGVGIAFVSEGKVVNTTKGSNEDGLALSQIASGRGLSSYIYRSVSLAGVLPSAEILLAAKTTPPEDPQIALMWVPLLGALLLAILAVVRSGR
jgi:hypothetical protein